MSVSNRILGEKYQLIRPLSQGGMGSVWLAEHLSLAAPVAVKLIAPELGTSSDFRQRFLQEAHAAAALRSPHVVQTLDYGVDGDTPYIVMELLEGESLAERLGRKGPLGPRQTELVLRHVSRAVARAHEQGIVHRDLKPANIFITRNEEEEVIKLFDFGIAKAMTDEAGSASAQTRTGSLLGTPAYMSPEQLEGCKDCDLRVDIWAMGVITYECLLGEPPFAGNGLGGLVHAILHGPLPVPSEQGAVPAGFDAWFARACARRRAERFSSAREAAQALRRVLAPELDSVDAEPSLPGDGSPLADTELRVRTAPTAVALPLRRREGADTGAPASATIRRASWSSRRLPGALAVVVAMGLLLSAGYWLWQSPAGLEQSAEPATLAAIEAEPLDSPSPNVRSPQPVITDLLSGSGTPGGGAGAPARAPVRAAPRPPANKPPAAERAAPARAASSPAPSATLTVTSSPSSHVLIDGAPKGSTPLYSARVRPGTHRVTLIYGKQRKTLYVETSAGENSVLSARFSEPEVVAAQQPKDAP